MLLNKCSSKLWWEYLKRNIQKVQTFNSKSKKYPAGTLSIWHVFYLGDFCFCVRQALNHMDVYAYQQLSNMRNTSEWSLDGQLGMGCVWPQACSMKSSFPSCKSDPDQLQGVVFLTWSCCTLVTCILLWWWCMVSHFIPSPVKNGELLEETIIIYTLHIIQKYI